MGAGIRFHVILSQSTESRCFIMLCWESTPCDVMKGQKEPHQYLSLSQMFTLLDSDLVSCPPPDMWKAQLPIYFSRKNRQINLEKCFEELFHFFNSSKWPLLLSSALCVSSVAGTTLRPGNGFDMGPLINKQTTTTTTKSTFRRQTRCNKKMNPKHVLNSFR